MNKSIDVVIYWVDGNDPSWRVEYELYKGKSLGRFRDIGVLKYVFRSIEFNMPWVRYVHFVTNGQKPNWLNLNDKLKFHTHKDIFYYNEALPVFNSSSIELNFSNIPNLSNKFILFNDDMLVLNKVSEDRFFKNDLPVDYIKLSYPRGGWLYNKLRPQNKQAVGFISNAYQYLKNKHVYNLRFDKVFSKRYSVFHNINNFLYCLLLRVFWYEVYHHPQPHLKSTWVKFLDDNECHKSAVKKTIFSKFRSENDINQYLYRFINLSMGCFFPCYFDDHASVYVNDVSDFEMKINEFLEKTFLCICEDENLSDDSFERLKNILNEALEIKLPYKSTFEN